jgi:SdpI/YfhL protein family
VFDLGALFALNFLLAVLSIPFLWHLVPRNRFYGFRVPATLRDDQVWYSMNRRVARVMIPVCGALAVSAVVFRQVGLDSPVGRNVLSVITIVAIAAVTLRGWSEANRLERFKQLPRQL